MTMGRNKLGYIDRSDPHFADDYIEAEKEEHPPQSLIKTEDVATPRRRVVLSGQPTVSRKPHLDALYGVGYVIAWDQLKRLEELSRERALDELELRQYVKLVEAVDRLSRGEREQQKHERLDQVDDKDLLAQAEAALKILEGK